MFMGSDNMKIASVFLCLLLILTVCSCSKNKEKISDFVSVNSSAKDGWNATENKDFSVDKLGDFLDDKDPPLFEEQALSSNVLVEFLDENDNLILSNENIENVLMGVSDIFYIQFNLADEGSSKFEKATQENIGKTFKVMVNGELITQPTINEPISSGGFIISFDVYKEMIDLFNTLTK